MDLNLSGRRALVTGASYGLGYGCARMLAQEGVDVAIVARDAEKLAAAAQDISSEFGVKTAGLAGDLARNDFLRDLPQKAREVLGGDIDILVVSTGHPPTRSFSQATDAQWKEGLDLVLQPAIELSRGCIDGMKKNGFGRIIFLGSMYGLEPEQSSIISSTFRTALNALMKGIATENAAFGVTANVICPGFFETPLVVGKLARQYANQNGTTVEAVLEDWKADAPVKKLGQPDDLGALTAFLASPRAEFITGTCIVMDGGALRQF